MSAIVAVVSDARLPAREEIARRALAAMSARGSAVTCVASCGGGTLAVASDEWEMSGDRAESLALARDGNLVAVADGSLYYRQDLRRALAARGERAQGGTIAHLVLAAYRAWGDQCASRLEGDFAFALWDADATRLVAARDVGATRPLFHVETRDGVLVASTIAGLLAAGAEPALNIPHLGEIAAGLALDETSTCVRAIGRVPAAHTLRRDRDASIVLTRHWVPPRFETGPRLALEDGAVVLRDLLTSAVRERLDANRPTSVWLSGGWDSPAAFAGGMVATGGDRERVRAVSISYPPGDPGREDELITAISARWNATPHWIDSASIGLLDDLRVGAMSRDEPFAHVFEQWNRALARGSRAVGSRVALHGNGGDQLFQVSLVYLADLVRRGRLLSLARECRARGVRDARTLFRWALQPLLPPRVLRAAAMLRGGRALRSYLERQVPAWINPGFAREHGLHERARAALTRRPGESFSSLESRYYLTHPYFPRVYACVSELARDEGVEVRSPLLDPRVIAFAAERPREERASKAETKRVLRAAMRGIVPDDVLAPRRARTGTTSRLFARALREHGEGLVAEATEGSRLAELGVVEPTLLKRAWRGWQSSQDGNLAVTIFLTVQTELWVRAREGAQPRLERAGSSYEREASAGSLS